MSNPFNIPGKQSVTTTSQATLTFAAAPTAVTVVWKVLSTISPAIASGTAFPIVLSLVVGTAIYLSAPQPIETRQKALNFFFALINSFAIAATTLGINSTLSAAPSTTSPSPIPTSPASPSP